MFIVGSYSIGNNAPCAGINKLQLCTKDKLKVTIANRNLNAKKNVIMWLHKADASTYM